MAHSPRRYAPIEYDEMPGPMVTANDYDALAQELKETIEAANGWERRCERFRAELNKIRDSIDEALRVRAGCEAPCPKCNCYHNRGECQVGVEHGS